jgi:iron complex transport system ATP-binding protein
LDVLTAPNRELARRVAVVSQFQDLNFDFSVRQMVLMGRTPFKKLLESDTAEDMAIVKHALEEVGLGDFGDRSYSTLSGGEKQRVVLARSIAQTPSFMILDEPTNHLDIKYQLKIMSTVKSLGIGVLAAMHDLSMAAMFSSYICLLKEGRVVAHGTPQEILTREVIHDVYEVDCLVTQDPETGRLSFTYQV